MDDIIHAADSLGMVIEMFGHTIYIEHNGPDGIQKAQAIKPNLILCDIGLPGMNGYQVAETLKSDKNLSATYLIALSGYAQPNDIENSHLAGFDYHLAKPPDLAKLKQILEEI
ncbi:response regulator [Legionella gratiana]|uniref:response regulator n=1 Tax=Legionella gratiana TaxID=45066 RepID=UPI0023781E3D|nr:response regulator [Legionella gratiana]